MTGMQKKMAGKRSVIQGLTYDRSFATDCVFCIMAISSTYTRVHTQFV